MIRSIEGKSKVGGSGRVKGLNSEKKSHFNIEKIGERRNDFITSS